MDREKLWWGLFSDLGLMRISYLLPLRFALHPGFYTSGPVGFLCCDEIGNRIEMVRTAAVSPGEFLVGGRFSILIRNARLEMGL